MKITSEFLDKRPYGLHEGADFEANKQTEIFAVLPGTKHNIYESAISGRSLIIKSNIRKDVKKEFDGEIFAAYLHMHKIIDKASYTTTETLGFAGNSGTVYTIYGEDGTPGRVYRKVSAKEQADSNNNFGSHLHLSVFQYLSSDLSLFRYVIYRTASYFTARPRLRITTCHSCSVLLRNPAAELRR